MIPVRFSGQHLAAETAAQIAGMIDHEAADLIRDHRTTVLCDKYDMVSQ